LGLKKNCSPAGQTSEAKIAAIGVRLRRGVTFHGFSLIVNVNLSHYKGIIPCGLTQYGVTSCADLGVDTTLRTVDQILKDTFPAQFFKGF